MQGARRDAAAQDGWRRARGPAPCRTDAGSSGRRAPKRKPSVVRLLTSNRQAGIAPTIPRRRSKSMRKMGRTRSQALPRKQRRRKPRPRVLPGGDNRAHRRGPFAGGRRYHPFARPPVSRVCDLLPSAGVFSAHIDMTGFRRLFAFAHSGIDRLSPTACADRTIG